MNAWLQWIQVLRTREGVVHVLQARSFHSHSKRPAHAQIRMRLVAHSPQRQTRQRTAGLPAAAACQRPR